MIETMNVSDAVINLESTDEVHSTLEAVEKYFRDKLRGGGRETGRSQGCEPGFPERVRLLREALGLSQAEFAERYGLDLSTLRGWEQGRRKPDKGNRTLLRAIEISPGIMANIIAKTHSPAEKRMGV